MLLIIAWGRHPLEHRKSTVLKNSLPGSYHCQLFLSERWDLEIIYSVYVEILAGLILCRSYVGNQSFCQFMSILVISCPEDNISQYFSLSSYIL